MSEASKRYDVLDGLRGLAAIGVLFYHIGVRLGAPAIVPRGYLAVDFFFLLSGFVIAHSYTDKIKTIGLAKFFQIRVNRLLPLSVLGVVLGTAYLLTRWIVQPSMSDDLPHLLEASTLNLALIPKLWIAKVTTDEVFPANGVLWSLSLEMAVNVLWAAAFVYARAWAMVLVSVLGAIVLALFAQHHGDANLGWSWGTYLGGVGRVSFGFFVGVLMWRFRPQATASRLMPWIASMALVAVFCLPTKGWWIDVVAILLVFPAVVFGASAVISDIDRPIFKLLGDISYPIYVIHIPAIMIISGITKKLYHHTELGAGAYWIALPLLVAALMVGQFYDAPVRRWLGGLSRGRGLKIRPAATVR